MVMCAVMESTQTNKESKQNKTKKMKRKQIKKTNKQNIKQTNKQNGRLLCIRMTTFLN